MDDDTAVADLIKALADLPGPSGCEEAVRERLLADWGPRMTSVAVDPVGNLLGRVGNRDGPRVVIDAHMDEIGYRVRHITDDGFLMLANAQQSQRMPQERRYMVGQPAQVWARSGIVARGVFAAPSGHVLTARLLEEGHLAISDFFVDLGKSSRADVEALGVHVGARVIFDVEARTLGSRIIGKALDDRLMLAVMTILLATLDPAALEVDLWFAATVQEENGMHGARALVGRERFDAAIALDVGLVGDYPGLPEGEVSTRLGGGPIVVHGDQGIEYSASMSSALTNLAEERGIPHQHGTFGHYLSNGIVFQDAGVPAALVTVPVRYTHTAFEMAELSDVKATIDLLHAFATCAGSVRR